MNEQKDESQNTPIVYQSKNWYVVWLGNVGDKYANTRHNAAWIVANFKFLKKDWSMSRYAPAAISEYSENGHFITNIRPTTLMNRSGQVLDFFEKKKDLTCQNTIVVHDDYHLPMGVIKVSHNRGDAGHNGVASVTNWLGTKKYTRIRIGIDECPPKMPLHRYVLLPFSQNDLKMVLSTTDTVFSIIKDITHGGPQKAMNRWNGKG